MKKKVLQSKQPINSQFIKINCKLLTQKQFVLKQTTIKCRKTFSKEWIGFDGHPKQQKWPRAKLADLEKQFAEYCSPTWGWMPLTERDRRTLGNSVKNIFTLHRTNFLFERGKYWYFYSALDTINPNRLSSEKQFAEYCSATWGWMPFISFFQ